MISSKNFHVISDLHVAISQRSSLSYLLCTRSKYHIHGKGHHVAHFQHYNFIVKNANAFPTVTDIANHASAI